MSAAAYLFFGFAIGGILFFIIGWLMGSRQRPIAPVDNRLEEELRVQLQKRDEELSQNRLQLSKAVEQNAELNERLNSLNERLLQERQQIESLQQKFHKDFEAISNKLLVASSSQFNRQSAESLEKLLNPLKEDLKDFKTKLENTQKETATHSALLKDQINRIGTEAANLSKALKGDVKALGNWGENMLDQILEKSGLQAGVHYRRQQSAKAEEGEQRFLDVLVELPDNKHLIIDSKVSLKCYEQQVNATDETLRSEHLQAHIECLRNHFRGLGAKRYQELYGINAPDFVLMYIPIEAAFFVAVAHEPGLFSEALDKNVVLTTNSTLLATLRTVASVWRLADQQKNAVEIARRGGQLYDKFVLFLEDLEKVGQALKKGQEAWESATNKLEKGAGNLIRQAEQLKALGVKASKSLPPHIKVRLEDEAVPSILPESAPSDNPV